MNERREESLGERFDGVMIQMAHLRRGAMILRDHQGEHDVEIYFAEELAEQVCRIQDELRAIRDEVAKGL